MFAIIRVPGTVRSCRLEGFQGLLLLSALLGGLCFPLVGSLGATAVLMSAFYGKRSVGQSAVSVARFLQVCRGSWCLFVCQSL